MSDNDIIASILSTCPNVTKEEVLEAFRIEKSKTGGLIADETLFRLIASRFGVIIPSDATTECRLLISHLVPRLNNVTISGRVVAVYPAKTFEGTQSGKYATLLIADKSGILRVVLWNGKADIVESGEIRVEQIVRFLRGYTREDRNGKTELHISEKGDTEINPRDLTNDHYPSIDAFTTKLKNISLSQPSIHLVGTVKSIFPSNTFKRQDNSTGKVLRFTITDDIDDVMVVAWNGKAELLEPILKNESKVKLVNARVKQDSKGGIEVHADDWTYAEVSSNLQQ